MFMDSVTEFSHGNIAKDIFTHISNFNTNKLKHVIIQTKNKIIEMTVSKYDIFVWKVPKCLEQ